MKVSKNNEIYARVKRESPFQFQISVGNEGQGGVELFISRFKLYRYYKCRYNLPPYSSTSLFILFFIVFTWPPPFRVIEVFRVMMEPESDIMNLSIFLFHLS